MANPAAPAATAEHEEKKKRITAAGAWALDAEREEKERAAAAAAAAASGADQSFPSLHAAVSAKTKRKKPVAIPLAKFVAPEPQRLTAADLLRLPTGPRERSADELHGSRPYSGFGSRPRPPPPPDLGLPSKADATEKWAAGKGFGFSTPPEPRRRYPDLGFGSSGLADEVDNWRSGKQPPPPPRYPTNNAVDSDRWGGGVVPEGRRRLVLDPPKRRDGSERPRSSPDVFGSARPREEVLREKGVIDSEIEEREMIRPASSHSSRPGTPEVGDGAVKPRPKVNPFGDAKPREVVLQEQGIDWKKVDFDLEHRSVDRPESLEEQSLTDEINLVKALIKDIEGNLNPKKSVQFSAEEIAKLRKQILVKESDLEQLTRQLDDQVRFSKRSSGDFRPGSGSGWPRSRGSIGEGWAMERGVLTDRNMDRPSSRGGIGEGWADRPRSHGSIGEGWAMERGVLTDRNRDRPSSRGSIGEGWADRPRSREALVKAGLAKEVW